MKNKESNVTKVPVTRSGIVFYFILIIIIIYIAAYIITFMLKPHISIYEVLRESLSTETTVTGVIVRQEEVKISDKAGYINYYYRDGARVKKNANIYSLDENKTIYDALEYEGSTLKLDEESIMEIKSRIVSFKQDFTNGNYESVKSFKQEITGKIQELADENLRNNLAGILDNTGLSSSFDAVATEKSGVITYHMDTLDGLTEDMVNLSTFNMDSYTKSYSRVDLCEAGSKVYKIITSNIWSIIAPVNNEIYEELSKRSSVNIIIRTDDLEIRVPVSTYTSGGQMYAKLLFDNYLTRYLSERFLDIEFVFSKPTGLKIPKSAVTEKEFFLVPKEYFTYGSGTNEEAYGLLVMSYNENMDTEYSFTETEIYYEDDTYAYVDTGQFTVNTFIYNTKTEERFRMSMLGNLTGVYNINKGYALFRRIEILEEKNGYYIIKEGTNKGIVLYDHIALDSSTVSENALIY